MDDTEHGPSHPDDMTLPPQSAQPRAYCTPYFPLQTGRAAHEAASDEGGHLTRGERHQQARDLGHDEKKKVVAGTVTSKVVKTLIRLVSTIGKKPKRKYRSVAPPAVEGGIPVMSEVTYKYNSGNSKNYLAVDTED